MSVTKGEFKSLTNSCAAADGESAAVWQNYKIDIGVVRELPTDGGLITEFYALRINEFRGLR